MIYQTFPKPIRYNSFEVMAECITCKRPVVLRPRQHSNGTKWLEGECEKNHIYKNFDSIDYLQPINPYYPLFYKNSDDEYNRKKKVAKIEEEQRKANLEKKYYDRYCGNNPNSTIKTHEKKSLIKEVLKED